MSREGATTLVDYMPPARQRVVLDWLTLESLRVAVTWGLWDAVSVTAGGARRYEQAATVFRDPRVLELVFDEAVFHASHEAARSAVKAAILPHVPQWRLEAYAHFPWDLKQP